MADEKHEPRQDEKSRDERRVRVSTMVGLGQILAMMIGFGSVIYTLGVKGEQLDAARREVENLTATVRAISEVQAAAAVADATNRASIEELRRRIDALERRMDALNPR